MNQSEQIADLAAALAKAQGAMDHASKDRTNPAFKSRYADLASVVDACRPALSQHGIAVLQPARVVDLRVEVDTLLVHQSGQWVCETLAASVKDAAAQTIGSAITYLRRYGLSAMVGVAPDDDDGNAARREPERREPERRQEARRPAEQPAAVEQAPAPDTKHAVAGEALARCLATYPAARAEIETAYHEAETADAALMRLRRIYARLAAAKPQLPQRDTSQAEIARKIVMILALLDRDGLKDGAKAVRETISEYGAELGVDGIANADLPSCLSTVEAIANAAFAEVAA